MFTEPEYLAMRAERMQCETKPVISSEPVTLALEFVMDCCSPEGLGHALPPEVVARAGRIAALLRPKRDQAPSAGYAEPPPPRCEWCDGE